MNTNKSEIRIPKSEIPHGEHRGKLIIISGPSGCGKSTICERILRSQLAGRNVSQYPQSEIRNPKFSMSVSATTRKPRAGEKDGVDYHFMSKGEFMRRIGDGAFLEYAEYCGNLYGTLRETADRALREGHFLLLEIDVQGALQLMDTDSSDLKRADCLYIFVKPPSSDALKERLEARATEDESAARKRLEISETEMKHSHRYDFCVVNDDLDTAVKETMDFVVHRTCSPEIEACTNERKECREN